jgi:hypothetical protein
MERVLQLLQTHWAWSSVRLRCPQLCFQCFWCQRKRQDNVGGIHWFVRNGNQVQTWAQANTFGIYRKLKLNASHVGFKPWRVFATCCILWFIPNENKWNLKSNNYNL